MVAFFIITHRVTKNLAEIVKEHITRFFQLDVMFDKIALCFVAVPDKIYAVERVFDIHNSLLPPCRHHDGTFADRFEFFKGASGSDGDT